MNARQELIKLADTEGCGIELFISEEQATAIRQLDQLMQDMVAEMYEQYGPDGTLMQRAAALGYGVER